MTTKPDRRHDRAFSNHTTVSVTALPPGWMNVWRLNDGTEFVEPCPALLLQEHRETDLVWNTPEHSRVHYETVTETPPYDTRTVFAAAEDGELVPVDDHSGYIRTEYRDPNEPLYAALSVLTAAVMGPNWRKSSKEGTE